jgi:hypothetical protein
MEKVAYIGHSYHLKTKSTEFFINLLKQHYQVDCIADDSWSGGQKPVLDRIDDSYNAVVFFQMISRQAIKNLKCKNIIYVPMYDQSGDYNNAHWYHFRNLKVICFSDNLKERLDSLGFYTLGVKYFPKPETMDEGLENSCFFWQRSNKIDWKVVKNLLSKSKVKNIHLHKAVDPGQNLILPSAEDSNKFKFEYTDWFKTKESYLKAMNKCQIYIAPRPKEGIGFSFLEAMARGKAVVAVNQATMNEYIQDGYNGYLYDFDNVRPIDFSNIDRVRENAFLSIQKGYDEWRKQEISIINFIQMPGRKNQYFLDHPMERFRGIRFSSVARTAIKYCLPYGLIRIVWYLEDGHGGLRMIKSFVKNFIPYGILKAIWNAKEQGALKRKKKSTL